MVRSEDLKARLVLLQFSEEFSQSQYWIKALRQAFNFFSVEYVDIRTQGIVCFLSFCLCVSMCECVYLFPRLSCCGNVKHTCQSWSWWSFPARPQWPTHNSGSLCSSLATPGRGWHQTALSSGPHKELEEQRGERRGEERRGEERRGEERRGDRDDTAQ